MRITIEGKYGIKATVLAYSINEMGQKFITWEIEYPRLVLAELNTHRMLSKNSFSSRAVPFLKMLEQLDGRPVRFGANQAGMQDQGEDYDALVESEPEGGYCFGDPCNYVTNVEAWEEAKEDAVKWAQRFYEAKYHKQVYNRLLEPFQMMKTVISGTETDNFFWLRDDDAADPSLHELARVMKEAKDASKPELLKAGEWHLPYVDYFQTVIGYTEDDQLIMGPREYFLGDIQGDDFQPITLEQAIKVSCARCAAVSYRNEGYGLEKSLEVYDRLVGDERKHASAFEHCATPMKAYAYYGQCVEVNEPSDPTTWEPGITHMDRQGNLWSGNLKGFIQYRKLIPGENYVDASN